jgi:hypothetical protein
LSGDGDPLRWRASDSGGGGPVAVADHELVHCKTASHHQNRRDCADDEPTAPIYRFGVTTCDATLHRCRDRTVVHPHPGRCHTDTAT